MGGGPIASSRTPGLRDCQGVREGLSPCPMSDNPSAPERGESPAPSDAASTPDTASSRATVRVPGGRRASRTWPSPRRSAVPWPTAATPTPRPVQAQAFDPVMQGKDLIVRSKTGHRQDRRLRPPPAGEDRPRGQGACARSSSAPPASWRSRWRPSSPDLGKHKGIRVTAIYGGASMQAAGGRAGERLADRRRHARPRLRPHPAEEPQARRAAGTSCSTRPTRC